MNIEFTARADRDFARLAPRLQAQLAKQMNLLRDNLRHPSIRAKKYDGA
jgi:mRNA-degrading endonuclease RelE of RelBE toxin-antitoxin system